MNDVRKNSDDDGGSRLPHRRDIIASVFIGSLIAVAYQEAVNPMRDSLQKSGLESGTTALFAVFILTSLRFCIGNYKHLNDLAENNAPGFLWGWDFFWITIQTVVLIFLGGLCSIEQSRTAINYWDFVTVLIVLYIIDVIWICTRWVLGKMNPAWKRFRNPWPWLALNSIQVVLIFALGRWGFKGNFYSAGMLIWLVVISCIAFIIDVSLDLIVPEKK